MNTELTLAVSTTISECIKSIINVYVKPKLEAKYKKDQLDKKFDLIEDKFDEYLERTYNNNLYMNTIVFKNQRKKLNDLYIPLTVSQNDSTDNKEKIKICIDSYGENFICNYKKVLLVDNAGMGKSTILKYLYLRAIKEKKGIPILIELRKLDKNSSIIEFIVNQINGIKPYFNKEDILDLIEGGGFIFFFDGYDEVTDESKKEITSNLQDFISKTSISKESENNFIISSRDESSLSCFSDFQRFDIKPLTKQEAYQLISKYDSNGELSKELINKLESEKNLKIIDEFLVNPLMVSLLYKSFEYKRIVPYKKQIFYRQVYDALFEDHDRSKGGAYVHPKKSELDIEDFHRVLRILGFITLSKGISYCKEELVKMISKAKKIATGMDFKENDFIYDIIHSVPLFIKDGLEYRWAHKSFQEYFAASYVCFDAKENQDKYLLTMIETEKSSKYYNVLDFCYDIDYKEFRKVIIYPIIKDFVEYYNNSYIDDKYKNYNLENLDLRKNLNFIYNEIYIKVIENDKFNIENKHKKHNFSRFEAIFKNWKSWQEREGICGLHHYKDCEIAIGYDYGNLNLDIIVDLLFNKKSCIIKELQSHKFNYDIEELIKCVGYNEYILNKENEDIPNGEEAFYLVTKLLIDGRRINRKFKPYLFNYNQCVKLKDKIEQEINSEEEFFL